MNPMQMVADFHRAFNHPIAAEPQPFDTDLATLRASLIVEERDELKAAIAADDRVAIVDALQDLKYVVCGAALALGAPLNDDPISLNDFLIGTDMIEEDHINLEAAVRDMEQAMRAGDFEGFAESLEDIYLAAQLLAQHYGFADQAHFAAVHLANMRKLGPDGKPIYRWDGKVLKPEGWTGPEADHERLIAA